MQVSGNRPLATTRAAKPVAVVRPAADTTSAPAEKPRTPQVKAQAQGPRAKMGVWAGAIGGGLAGAVGIGAPAAFINWIAQGALLSPLGLVGVIAGAAVIGGGVGAAMGWAQGTVEDKVLDKVAKNPTSQWGFYVSGYGLLHAGGALLKGAATGLNGSLSGIGSVLGGVWQTAVEVKGLKEGGPLGDNKLRLAGAAAATVGGLAAASALVPAVAAAVPLIVPVGIGLAALGWGANLVGQFLNEKRHEATK